MNAPKVFVFSPQDKIFASADVAGNIYGELEAHGCALVYGDEGWQHADPKNEAAMAAMAAGSTAMMGGSLRNSPISRRVIEAAGRPRILAKYSIGVDDVDVDAATELGILVTHSPTEANWGGVAEGTIANMLAMLKKIRERDRLLKVDRGWKEKNLEGIYVGPRADGYPGITIGLIGLGRVGGRVAKLLRPWEARVLACDPYVADEKFDALGVERADLDTVLSQSDVVSLHVNLTHETRHMIGAAEFRRMKPGAIFINTARGFCVDEAAMIEALGKDVIAGAALDAFEVEPVAEDSPLRDLGDKVLLSPHMISATIGAGLHQGIEWAHRSVLTALRGEVPDCVYNTDVIPRWEAEYGGRSVLED